MGRLFKIHIKYFWCLIFLKFVHKVSMFIYIYLVILGLITKFQLKLTIKTVFAVKSRKSEHHYSILHIRISLGTKFQPKLTILIF